MKRYRFLIDTMAECDCDAVEELHGEYVRYVDHEAAMKAALQRQMLTIRDKEAAEERGAVAGIQEELIEITARLIESYSEAVKSRNGASIGLRLALNVVQSRRLSIAASGEHTSPATGTDEEPG